MPIHCCGLIVCPSYTGSFLGHKTARCPSAWKRSKMAYPTLFPLKCWSSVHFRGSHVKTWVFEDPRAFCCPKVFGWSKNEGEAPTVRGPVVPAGRAGCIAQPCWNQSGDQGAVVPGCWPVVPPRSGCGTTGTTTGGTTGRRAHPL